MYYVTINWPSTQTFPEIRFARRLGPNIMRERIYFCNYFKGTKEILIMLCVFRTSISLRRILCITIHSINLKTSRSQMELKKLSRRPHASRSLSRKFPLKLESAQDLMWFSNLVWPTFLFVRLCHLNECWWHFRIDISTYSICCGCVESKIKPNRLF